MQLLHCKGGIPFGFLEAAAVDLSVVFHCNDAKALVFWSLDFVDPPYACVTPPYGYILNILVF